MNAGRTSHRPPLRSAAVALFATVLATAGCAPKINSGAGFQLPKGDAARGQQAFVRLGCTSCHTVDGVELPKPSDPSAKIVKLGGDFLQTWTYGRLMTAIIHPTRSVASQVRVAAGKPPVKSDMPVMNDTMTVEELVDLITFLQPHYRTLQPVFETPLLP